jgi:hypothetical protein
MQNNPWNVTVPLSRSLGVGQRDSSYNYRDSAGTRTGTVDLKLLATALLTRDKRWDTEDRQEHFEERAAILEFDGGLSRANAESQALSKE